MNATEREQAIRGPRSPEGAPQVPSKAGLHPQPDARLARSEAKARLSPLK